MPYTLLISPRLADRRIWGDIPARLAGQSETVFCDRYPASAAGLPVDLGIRKLLPADRSAFDVVAGAEDAARLAVGLVLDGLANGLVLFQPVLDAIPPELEPADLSGLEERARLSAPLVAAVDEPDPAAWESLVADVVDQAIGIHLTPNDAALVRDVISSHAGELQRELQDAIAARSRGQGRQAPADAPGRWIDRLREVPVPVVILSTHQGFRVAEVLAARAPHGHALLARGEAGIPWLEDRDKAVAILADVVKRSAQP